MNKKIILYLARHGQTLWNVENRLQGQLNSSLTDEGKSESLQLAAYCLDLNITHILSSPSARALQTATICSEFLHIKQSTVDHFKARNFGVWQGELTSHLQSQQDYVEITSQITDRAPDNGESARSLLARFDNAIKNQLESSPNETYLMITHGEVLRCFMAQFQRYKALKTGCDYKNALLIPLSYDLKTKTFSLL